MPVFDFHKTPHIQVVALINLAFVSILAPYWFIFQFANDLFIKTDLLKLILLSAAFGFPIVAFNVSFMVVITIGERNLYIKNDFSALMLSGSLITLAALFSPAIFLGRQHMFLKEAVRIAMISEAVLAIIITLTFMITNFYKQRRLKKSGAARSNQSANVTYVKSFSKGYSSSWTYLK